MQDRMKLNEDIIKTLKNQQIRIKEIDITKEKSKFEEIKDAYIELTSVERMPIDFVKIRRDRTAGDGKLRKKLINICSNIVPNQIFVNGTYCPFRITKKYNIIKIDVAEVCSGLPSGWYNFEILLCYGSHSVKDTVKIDFRARGHNRKRGDHDLEQNRITITDK